MVVAAYGLIAAALWVNIASAGDRALGGEKYLQKICFVFIGSCAATAFVYIVHRDTLIWTWHMRAFGALPPLCGAFIAARYGLLSRGGIGAGARAALAASMALFAYGGALGFLIREENAVVPSHYHASIVAITVAAMGYFLRRQTAGLPRLRRVSIAYGLLLAYAAAQALHVTGLYVMGGYGALRKDPGSLTDTASLGAAMFFAGGGMAILCAAGFAIAFFCTALVSAKRPA